MQGGKTTSPSISFPILALLFFALCVFGSFLSLPLYLGTYLLFYLCVVFEIHVFHLHNFWWEAHSFDLTFLSFHALIQTFSLVLGSSFLASIFPCHFSHGNHNSFHYTTPFSSVLQTAFTTICLLAPIINLQNSLSWQILNLCFHIEFWDNGNRDGVAKINYINSRSVVVGEL
jgi:hypothetical protein